MYVINEGNEHPTKDSGKNIYYCCIVAPNLSKSSNRFSSTTLHLGSQQQNYGVCFALMSFATETFKHAEWRNIPYFETPRRKFLVY